MNTKISNTLPHGTPTSTGENSPQSSVSLGPTGSKADSAKTCLSTQSEGKRILKTLLIEGYSEGVFDSAFVDRLFDRYQLHSL